MRIVAAGMPRSGSTWLYNVVRLILESSQEYADEYVVGWVEDVNTNSANLLVKVHKYCEELSSSADLVFYSYRDVRDAIASTKRKFHLEPSLELARHYLDEDAKWRRVADCTVRYEDIVSEPLRSIQRILNCLKVADVTAEKVSALAEVLSYESEGDKNSRYNELNLFHKGHITDGKSRSWSQVDPNLIEDIYELNRKWFNDNNYLP